MKVYAVIDRIIQDKVVLLIGRLEREVIVPLSSFPVSYKPREGDSIIIEMTENSFVILGFDDQKTQSDRQRIEKKLQSLRNRD